MRKHRIALYLGLIGMLAMSFVAVTKVFLSVRPSLAEINTWTQTDWSGGVDGGAVAIHPTDQTGWTEYASISNASDVVSPGDVVLATGNFSATDDGTLTTTGFASGGGFGNGAPVNTAVSGSGAASRVRLSGISTSADIFDSNIPLVPGSVSTGSAMIRNGAADDIYVMQGNSSTGFFKYTISTNTWTTLAAVPGAVGVGSVMMRNGADDDIYVLRGNASANFFKYSISGNSWSTLTAVPSLVGTGSAMIRNGANNDIYVLPGGVAKFYRYLISGNSWTTLTDAPGVTSFAAALIRNGSDDDMYLLQGGGTGFHRYSISGNSWTTLTAVPGSISLGGGIMRNSADDDIYVLQGNGTTGFFRYSITGNSWTALTPVTTAIGNGGYMIRNGGDDEVYVLKGSNDTAFRKYSVAGNSWSTLTAVPGALQLGTGMIRNGADNEIYILQGNNSRGFHKYSISGNSWLGTSVSALAAAPETIGGGGAMIRDTNSEDVYVLRGNFSTSFFKYTIFTDSWTTLAPTPISIGTNSVMIRNGSDDELYVLRGGSANLFRYSIAGNSWTTLASAPSTVTTGALMFRNGGDDEIYVFRGGSTSFFKYSIAGDSWTTLTAAPATVGVGSAAIRGGDDIYLLQGNVATGFFKYSITGNSWTTLTAVPGTVNDGSGMIRNASDDDIYVLRGSSTGFFRYSIAGNSWTTLTAVPGSVGLGGHMIRNGGDDEIYVLRGNGTGFSRYSITGNSWIALASVPSDVFSGSAMIRNADDNQIYILQGNTKTNLWKYRINLDTYDTSGTFTSAVIDTVGVISFGNLSWTSATLLGTTLTFATRSGDVAVPDGTWSAWSAELSNAAGSAITSPAARYIQYRGSFATTDTERTPTLNDLSVAYSAYQPAGNLVSSAFNSIDPGNVLAGLSWTEDVTLPAGATVTISLRTASASGGLVGAWTDFTNGTSNCGKVSATVTCTAAALPVALTSGNNDQYLQYKVGLATTNTVNTPTVGSVAVSYGVNVSSNRGEGSITVVKSVINDNGGTKTVADFPLFINGVQVDSGFAYTFLAGNTYRVSETEDAGYQRAFSGDCDNNGQVVLNAGDRKVCTVTNDDVGESALEPVPVDPVDDPSQEPEPEPVLSSPLIIDELIDSVPSIDIDKGLIAPPSGQPTACVAGLLMKLPGDSNSETSNDSTVYICGIDGKRYIFPDEGTYFSWYDDFSLVQVLMAQELEAIPLGDLVTYRPGSRMVKIMSSPKVYLVDRGGVLRWVQNEEIAARFYGPDWNTMISDLDVTVFDSYIIGEPLII